MAAAALGQVAIASPKKEVSFAGGSAAIAKYSSTVATQDAASELPQTPLTLIELSNQPGLSPFWGNYLEILTGQSPAPLALPEQAPVRLDLIGWIDASQASAGQRNLIANKPAEYPALRSTTDEALQQALEEILQSPAMERAAREKRLAAALVDITDLNNPRMALVNGDVMMYAASLPKIAILLGVFEQAEASGATLDSATLASVTRMIRNSSNKAATEMFYKVGPANLAAILESPRYRLYDREAGGGLWVGKPYAKKTTWQRDPLHNLSHGATAFQVARFFYLLETGRLVSGQSSLAMKKILGDPAIRHKFVKGLSARPHSKIFRKSGTWRTYHSDAGIIERDGKRYIAVVLANDLAASAWLSQLIIQFDSLIHG